MAKIPQIHKQITGLKVIGLHQSLSRGFCHHSLFAALKFSGINYLFHWIRSCTQYPLPFPLLCTTVVNVSLSLSLYFFKAKFNLKKGLEFAGKTKAFCLHLTVRFPSQILLTLSLYIRVHGCPSQGAHPTLSLSLLPSHSLYLWVHGCLSQS